MRDEPKLQPLCPHCRELAEQVSLLTEQNRALAERLDALSKELEQAKRTGKRQAAPFRRDKPKKDKKDPKKSGRGKGHKGSRRKKPGKVDRTLKAPPLEACPDCGGPLEDLKQEENHQTEIPPVEPVTTRFEFESAWCPTCGKRVYSRHEEQTSTATHAAGCHLGPRVLAFAADLKTRLGIPYRKVTDILRQSFSLNVSAGALCQANDRLAVRAGPTIEAMEETLRQEKVVSADETGWRIGTQPGWLWVTCSENLTIYKIAPHRCATVVLEILGEDFQGTLMRDGWSSYDARLDCAMLRCLFHLRHNVEALEDRQIGRAAEDAALFGAWIDGVFDLRARHEELSGQEYVQGVVEMVEWFDEFTAAEHVSEFNAGFAERMEAIRDQVVPYILDPTLPATNNLGERQTRPMVIHRKISAGNKTWNGAATLAKLASLTASCRQRGIDFVRVASALLHLGGEEAIRFWEWDRVIEAR